MSSAQIESGTIPGNLADLVKSVATEGSSRPKPVGFSLSKGGAVELAVAPILGLYLGYAVGRLPEVFQSVNVPHLPLFLMLVFLGILGLSVPSDAWEKVWNNSRPLRLVAILVVLAFATIPTSFWPSGSLEYLRQRYMVSLVVFLCCLIFLRDRRAFRWAMMLYVLCITAVAADTLKTFDPNAIQYDEDGEPIEFSADRARVYVGVSLDPNDFGAILAATFPLALWLGVGSFRRRLFWGACALTLVAAVVPTSSRGSMLAFLAAATALLGVGARGWRRVLTFFLVAGGVALFIGLASGAQMGRFTAFSADDYNVEGNEGRWYFWKQGFIWMLKRPWGWGLDSFPGYFGMQNDGIERAAHSIWVQYGMELGVAGLVTIATLSAFMFRALYRHRQAAIRLGGTFAGAREEEALASHLIAYLAAILVSGTFLSIAYNPILYMAIGLVAAMLLGSPLPALAPPQAVEPGLPQSQGHGRRVARQWIRQT